MEPKECEHYEEALLHFVIEASLKEVEDDIVEIDPKVTLVQQRPVSNKQAINVVLCEEMHA